MSSEPADDSFQTIQTLAGPHTPPIPGHAQNPFPAARLEAEPTVAASAGTSAYVLLEKIAEGGMGVVHRARHTKLNRIVALKMMLAGERSTRADLIRFLAEAEAVAAVKHPNVVEVYDYGEIEGRPFIALEFLHGGSLARILSRERETDGPATSPHEAAALLAQIADGVSAAHAQGIVHRDLKPANVLLDEAGVPKVADFGLAKRGDGSDVTRTGQVIGTPAYMSPEQAKGENKFVGPQADVWALGVILYEALTGQRPFTGSVQEILAKVQSADPLPPRKLVPAIPRDLELICLKCLAKPPHERYPTARELANDLDLFLLSKPISIRPAGTLERHYKWVKRNPALAALYAALAASAFFMVVGGILAWAASEARGARAIAENERNKAEEEREKAEQLRGAADVARQQAIVQQQLAEAARTEAKKSEQSALSAQLRESAARKEADEAAYRLKVATAAYAWQDHAVLRALRLLDATNPEYRDFEWRYVAKLCQSELRTIRPGGRLWGMSVSPDGRVAYVGSLDDQLVRGYEIKTGQQLVAYRGHEAKPWVTLLLDEGQRVVSSALDGSLHIWNAATGESIKQLSIPNAPRPCHTTLALSPDGKWLAATSLKSVVLWDTATFEERREIMAGQSVSALAFLSDSRLLTGYSDGRLRVWDAATGQAVGGPISQRGAVQAIARSPDGSRVWTGDDNGRIYSWEVPDLKPLSDYQAHDGAICSIRWAASGKQMLTGSLDQTAVLWDLATLKRLRIFRGHTEDVTNAVMLLGGQSIVTCGDGTIRLWDATRDAEALVLTPPRPRGLPASATVPVFAVGFSPDEKFLAAAVPTGICVWDVASGKLAPHWPAREWMSPQTVAFSPDGKFLAGGTVSRVWVRPVAGGEGKSWEVGVGPVSQVAFDPTGTLLAVSGFGGASRVLNLTTGSVVWVSSGGSPGRTIAYSRDGRHVATAEGKMVCIRDAATGAPEHTLAGHAQDILSLAYNEDGTRLVSGSQDTTAIVWDVATGTRGLTLRTHDHYIYGVAFSPDGKRLVDACGDKTVRLYDTRTGEEALTLRGHTNEIYGVAFSRKGNYLATCDKDGAIRLWSAPRGVTVNVPQEANQPHSTD